MQFKLRFYCLCGWKGSRTRTNTDPCPHCGGKVSERKPGNMTEESSPKIGDGTADAALAIGEDAFRAGWVSALAWCKSEGFYFPNPDAAVAPMFKAWSDYDPPEHIKDLA